LELIWAPILAHIFVEYNYSLDNMEAMLLSLPRVFRYGFFLIYAFRWFSLENLN
jgi:hypothetical protein